MGLSARKRTRSPNSECLSQPQHLQTNLWGQLGWWQRWWKCRWTWGAERVLDLSAALFLPSLPGLLPLRSSGKNKEKMYGEKKISWEMVDTEACQFVDKILELRFWECQPLSWAQPWLTAVILAMPKGTSPTESGLERFCTMVQTCHGSQICSSASSKTLGLCYLNSWCEEFGNFRKDILMFWKSSLWTHIA